MKRRRARKKCTREKIPASETSATSALKRARIGEKSEWEDLKMGKKGTTRANENGRPFTSAFSCAKETRRSHQKQPEKMENGA